MSKVTLKVEIDEEAYKIIMNTSVIANEEMLLKGSAKDLKTTEAMLKFIDAIHETTPLTESDDCVSRQAVLGIIKRNTIPLLNTIKHLEDLPSVLPKRERSDKE